MAIKYNDKSYFLTMNEFVNEMAINNDEIEKATTFLLDISKEKENIKFLKQILKDLINALTNCNEAFLTKHSKNGSTMVYMVSYDRKAERILSMIREIISKDIPEKLRSLYNKVLFPSGNENLFFTFVHIFDNLNRIHVPEGLPEILQGVGVGKKIYRAAIKKAGYISTNKFDRSVDAITVWDSLRKDHDIFSFIEGDNMICFDGNKSFNDTWGILKDFFAYEIEQEKSGNSLNTYVIDYDFRQKFRSEILDTDMKYLLK